MYKTIDFVKAYAERRGFTIEKEEDAMEILLPYVMMNVAYQCYIDNIKDLNLREDAKKARKDWKEAYTRFNRFLFDSFDNADMVDDFCEQLDKFRKFMYLDTVKLQSRMMRVLPQDLTGDEKNVLSAAMLCNRIAHESQKLWNRNICVNLTATVLVNGKRKQIVRKVGTVNNDLNGVITATKKFATALMKKNPKMRVIVTEDVFVKEMYESLDAFAKRCILFAKLDKNEL